MIERDGGWREKGCNRERVVGEGGGQREGGGDRGGKGGTEREVGEGVGQREGGGGGWGTERGWWGKGV